ncbi:MAG: mechanosensitive ion channel [Chlorobi bacterium]|nr:mechanosensitive ion channel [Chlorobiota bacterium]
MAHKIDFLFAEWLKIIGMSDMAIIWLKSGIYIILMLIVAYIADRLTKKILLGSLKKFVDHSKSTWDDIMYNKGVFNRVVHVVPALIIFYVSHFIFKEYETILVIIRSSFYIYLIILGIFVFDSFINALHDIYNQYPFSKNRPIKGYIQVVKIFLYFIGIIVILSILLNKSPVYFLSGLGALAAVLLLVFKDTILGFVASIQLSANKMVRIGDWISMPSHKADGTVVEISLNTVKVQNWDKTISTIPTYALVAESFNNWRGMEESGGRRIKRSINIDMKSIKFCTPEMLEKYKKIKILSDYIQTKKKKLDEYNTKNNLDNSVLVNGRRMTNIGTFRKYIELYLHEHPKIHDNMTFLVRQLQPTEKGLPIEIYVFSKDQEWAKYEALQADIFDHILAIINEFDLRIFQNPTGNDFEKLVNR